MKISKYIILSTSLFLFACKGNEVPKPINLSFEETKEYVKSKYNLSSAEAPIFGTVSYTGAVDPISIGKIIQYCDSGISLTTPQDTISLNNVTLNLYKNDLDTLISTPKAGALITLNEAFLNYLISIEPEGPTLSGAFKHTYTRLADTLIIDGVNEIDANNKTEIHHTYDVKGRETNFYIIQKNSIPSYDYSVTLNFVYNN